MAWAPLAAAGVSAAAGYLGSQKAAKSAKDAQRIRDRAAEQIYGLEIPDIDQLQYNPELAAYAGDIDPQLLSQLGDVQSEFGNITTDPRFATAQYQSLGGLDDIVNSGGLTAIDKLNFQKAQNEAAAQSAREQGNITRDLAERGLGGSGMEMAQRLQSSQGAANRGSEAAQLQAATAQQRALDAMLQRGQLGGEMQSADFQRQARAAEAKDLINKFNTTNAYNVQQQNATMANQALAGNRDTRQAHLNSTANTRNEALRYNTGAVGDRAGMQMDKAIAGGNAATGQANARIAQGNATKDQYAGFGQGITTAAGAYADYDKSKQK